MAGDDFFSQVGRQLLWRSTLLLQHSDIVALTTLRLLLPPEAQRRHIVGSNGADRTDGVGLQMGIFETLLLGQLLYFERQDAQLVKDGFHAVGQHS